MRLVVFGQNFGVSGSIDRFWRDQKPVNLRNLVKRSILSRITSILSKIPQILWILARKSDSAKDSRTRALGQNWPKKGPILAGPVIEPWLGKNLRFLRIFAKNFCQNFCKNYDDSVGSESEGPGFKDPLTQTQSARPTESKFLGPTRARSRF